METPESTTETTPEADAPEAEVETAEQIVHRELAEEAAVETGVETEVEDDATDTDPPVDDKESPDEPDPEADKPEPDADPDPKAEADDTADAVSDEAIEALDALAKFGISKDTLDQLAPDELVNLAGTLKPKPDPEAETKDTEADGEGGEKKTDGVTDALNDVFDENEASSIRAALTTQAKAMVEAILPQLNELKAGMLAMATNAGPLLRDQHRPKLLEAFPEVEDDAVWNKVQARAQTLSADPRFAQSPGEALSHAAYIETYAGRKTAANTKTATVNRKRGNSQTVTTRGRNGKVPKALTADEILDRNVAIAAGTDMDSPAARQNASTAMRSNGSLKVG